MSLFLGTLGATFGGSFGSAWVCEEQVIAARQAKIAACFSGVSYIGLPPGIFWERVDGKTHRVVIRRETEYVPGILGYGIWA